MASDNVALTFKFANLRARQETSFADLPRRNKEMPVPAAFLQQPGNPRGGTFSPIIECQKKGECGRFGVQKIVRSTGLIPADFSDCSLVCREFSTVQFISRRPRSRETAGIPIVAIDDVME